MGILGSSKYIEDCSGFNKVLHELHSVYFLSYNTLFQSIYKTVSLLQLLIVLEENCIS